MNGRVKSTGDLLDSRSLSENADFYLDDVSGRTSRPKSMYEGSNLRLVNNTNQVCNLCIFMHEFYWDFVLFLFIHHLRLLYFV